jgi:hypothetical protein
MDAARVNITASPLRVMRVGLRPVHDQELAMARWPAQASACLASIRRFADTMEAQV